MIGLYVLTEDDNEIDEVPQGSIDGTSTSATIPAGTLSPVRTYEAGLFFARVMDIDDTGYTRAPAATAVFAKITLFETQPICDAFPAREGVLCLERRQGNDDTEVVAPTTCECSGRVRLTPSQTTEVHAVRTRCRSDKRDTGSKAYFVDIRALFSGNAVLPTAPSLAALEDIQSLPEKALS